MRRVRAKKLSARPTPPGRRARPQSFGSRTGPVDGSRNWPKPNSTTPPPRKNSSGMKKIPTRWSAPSRHLTTPAAHNTSMSLWTALYERRIVATSPLIVSSWPSTIIWKICQRHALPSAANTLTGSSSDPGAAGKPGDEPANEADPGTKPGD